LCHGLVFDVKWPGLNVLSKNVVPKIDTATGWVPYVAAGNSATDCISAFMQWQINYNKKIVGATFNENDIQVEKMLEAFSHKMLIQPGGVYDTPELDNVIRESWFGKMPGGFIWVAQAPPKAGELSPEDGNKDSLAQLPNDRALGAGRAKQSAIRLRRKKPRTGNIATAAVCRLVKSKYLLSFANASSFAQRLQCE
jgi:hypothetical protein